jgi:hypothetical protein
VKTSAALKQICTIDPALFIRQRIDAKMINLLINGVAFQPTEYISITETKPVQPTWFYKRLPDKSVQLTPAIWLSYSIYAVR